MTIHLGSIQLPINGATKTFSILVKRGAGKSYTLNLSYFVARKI